MEEKKNLGEKLGTFFAGKGYYIVLLLSAAVIATSIWLMAAGSRANVEDETGMDPETITNASAGEESRPVIEPIVPGDGGDGGVNDPGTGGSGGGGRDETVSHHRTHPGADGSGPGDLGGGLLYLAGKRPGGPGPQHGGPDL